MDLSELYQNKRYIALMDYIDQLPQTSRYYAALMNDPEVSRALAESQLEREDSEDEAPEWHPSISDFGLEHQILARISDQLQQLTSVTVAANRGKPDQFKPFPRPVSGIERAREELDREIANSLVARFGFGDDYF